MKKKIFSILPIILLFSSFIFLSNIKTTQAYWTYNHTNYFMGKRDISQQGAIELMENYDSVLPYHSEILNLLDELIPLTGSISNFNCLMNGQDYADGGLSGFEDGWLKKKERQDDHFWDPITLDGLYASDGAPYFVKYFFDSAINFYLQHMQGNDVFSNEYFALPWEGGPWMGYERLLDIEIDIHIPSILDDVSGFCSNNKERAYFLLGIAQHMVQDVTLPVHAVGNEYDGRFRWIGGADDAEYWHDLGLPFHSDVERAYSRHFRDQKDAQRNYFIVNNQGDYGLKEDWNGDYNVYGWVQQAALVGKSQYNDVAMDIIEFQDFTKPNGDVIEVLDYTANPQSLIDAIEFGCQKAIALSAGFLFYFWQYMHSYPGISDYIIDLDGDGLHIRDEEALHTNPFEIDTDFDGLDDYDELQYWDYHNLDPLTDLDNDGLININDDDSDDDGLLDGEEFVLGSYAFDPDFDDDGLIDGHEMNVWGTDLFDDDCDDDGLNDYEEIIVYTTDPWSDDSDLDGYTDYEEVVIYGTNPNLAFDHPGRFTPNAVPTFVGHSNLVCGIVFTWNEPTNFQPGWLYKVFVNKNGNYINIYEGTNRDFYFEDFTQHGLSLTTAYTYRIACYNVDDYPGSYSYWTGKVKDDGGWHFF